MTGFLQLFANDELFKFQINTSLKWFVRKDFSINVSNKLRNQSLLHYVNVSVMPILLTCNY